MSYTAILAKVLAFEAVDVWFTSQARMVPWELYFPSVSPTYGLYLPLPRTRKLRGWYQVKQFSAAATPTRTDRSTSPVLLPEIGRLVACELRAMCEEDLTSYYPASAKRICIGCTLVCREWYRILRPVIFSSLQLRSRSDIEKLMSALGSSTEIKRGLRHVMLAAAPSCAPFLHHMHKVPPHPPQGHTPRLVIARIEMDDIATSPGRHISSIHWMLPRSLPPNSQSCHNINGLVLERIKFCSLKDLTRLIRQLPSLTTMTGTKLFWPLHGAAESLELWQSPRTPTRSYRELFLTDCTEYTPLIAIVLGLPRTQATTLAMEAFAVILTGVKSAAHGVIARIDHSLPDIVVLSMHLDIVVLFTQPNLPWTSLWARGDVYATWSFKFPSPGSGQMQRMELHYGGSAERFHAFEKISWDSLNALLSGVPELARFFLLIKDEGLRERFRSRADTVLPHLLARQKFHFVQRYKTGTRIACGGPYWVDMTDTGNAALRVGSQSGFRRREMRVLEFTDLCEWMIHFSTVSQQIV